MLMLSPSFLPLARPLPTHSCPAIIIASTAVGVAVGRRVGGGRFGRGFPDGVGGVVDTADCCNKGGLVLTSGFYYVLGCFHYYVYVYMYMYVHMYSKRPRRFECPEKKETHLSIVSFPNPHYPPRLPPIVSVSYCAVRRLERVGAERVLM